MVKKKTQTTKSDQKLKSKKSNPAKEIKDLIDDTREGLLSRKTRSNLKN
jgi:hypothetical protein